MAVIDVKFPKTIVKTGPVTVSDTLTNQEKEEKALVIGNRLYFDKKIVLSDNDLESLIVSTSYKKDED